MKILLIAGHGAGDVGSCGNGYQEFNLTRELVNLIAPKLRNYATVDIYDQNRNAFADVQNGTFNISNYDYALEIHFNAFNGSAKGTEIYVTNAESGISVENEIMKQLSNFFNVRGVKKKDFAVIKTIKSKGISSALLETCFIDNLFDIAMYKSKKEEIATAIVNGIVNGFGLNKNEQTQSQPKPEPPKPTSTTKYKVGTPVCTNTLATSSTGGTVHKGAWEGTITKVVAGTPYPYLLNNGTGWTNDHGIDTDPRIPGSVVRKSNEQIADEVIAGKWGNGADRTNRLRNAGYDPNVIQGIVNRKLA